MSYHIRLLSDEGIYVCEVYGEVTIQDLRECSEYARAHPQDLLDLHHLVVYRDGSRINFSTNEMTMFAASASGNRYNAHRIIVASDELTFGMSRMLEMLRYKLGDEITVVRTLKEAADLLHVSDRLLEDVAARKAGELLASHDDQTGSAGNLNAS